MAFWSNGLGEALGDDLVIRGQPLWTGGAVWWVNSETGTDAAAPAGKERLQPLATLSQAHTNAAAGDVIVLMDGHNETVADLTISKRVTIVGAGQSDGKPTVKLTPGASVSAMITLSATYVEIRNVWILEPAAASAVPIVITNDGARFVGLYHELGANNNAEGFQIDNSGPIEFKDCTFISTATAASDPPEPAIRPVDGTNLVLMDGVVFDGGSYGFAEGCAYDEDGAVAALIVHAESVSLLRGADMRLISSTTGYVQVATSTGGAQLRFDGAIA